VLRVPVSHRRDKVAAQRAGKKQTLPGKSGQRRNRQQLPEKEASKLLGVKSVPLHQQ